MRRLRDYFDKKWGYRCFWHSRRGTIGGIRNGDPQSPKYCPEHLLVFVHGVNADYLKTWRHLPKWLIRRLGVEIDVFNFSYPSKAWHKASIQQAALKLLADLNNQFPLARNITF